MCPIGPSRAVRIPGAPCPTVSSRRTWFARRSPGRRRPYRRDQAGVARLAIGRPSLRGRRAISNSSSTVASRPRQGSWDDDYDRVVTGVRLADVTLGRFGAFDVSEETAATLKQGSMLALKDDEGSCSPCSTSATSGSRTANRGEMVYGTTNREHPGVAALLDRSGAWYVGGTHRSPRPPPPLRLRRAADDSSPGYASGLYRRGGGASSPFRRVTRFTAPTSS